MNIVVIGVGYVGLVTGACFAEFGHKVTCVDVNQQKMSDLKNGIIPIYEPELDALVHSNLKNGRLFFRTSLAETLEAPDIIFITVGTPIDNNGDADTKYVLTVAKEIGQYIKKECVVVDKSTVPVGVTHQIQAIIKKELECRHSFIPFDIVSNPEFLREGAAVTDFMNPDRIIVGLTSDRAKKMMLELYLPIVRQPEKIYFMRIKEAEMTKYAANAMLATRISCMNEIAVLCERLGVDVENVRMGIGSDSRIGPLFIYPGCGYGGSCFSKDVKALIKMAEQHNMDPLLLRAVEARNIQQKKILPQKIIQLFGNDLSNITIAVWGLSFKPGTNDMREASSIVLLETLFNGNAQIKAYDPVAIPTAKDFLPKEWMESGQLHFVEHAYAALEEADALVLVTEWKPFCYPDLTKMKKLMRRLIILDGRNQYDPKQMREANFEYYGIGRSINT